MRPRGVSVNKSRSKALRNLLCASVSTLALATVSARAADLHTPYYKAPAPATGTLTVWGEGGAFWTGQDPVHFVVPSGLGAFFTTATTGLTTGSGFDPRVGIEGAIGADYNFAGTPWHASFDMRYGAATAASQSFRASVSVGTGTTALASAQGMGEREDHAVADFMLGRDIGAMTQLQFGLRIAYLGANLTETASVSSTSGSASGAVTNTALMSSDERSTFVGAGPRVALQGAYPIAPSWAVEYMAGAAALVGERQFNANGTASCSNTNAACVTGVTFTTGMFSTQISEGTVIFNTDESIALALSLIHI